jgi:hypothetical protein
MVARLQKDRLTTSRKDISEEIEKIRQIGWTTALKWSATDTLVTWEQEQVI